MLRRTIRTGVNLLNRLRSSFDVCILILCMVQLLLVTRTWRSCLLSIDLIKAGVVRLVGPIISLWGTVDATVWFIVGPDRWMTMCARVVSLRISSVVLR